MNFKITVYAGPSETSSKTGGRAASVAVHEAASGNVDETLRLIGLEYRLADYFPTRQVVITIDPITDSGNLQAAKRKVEEAHYAIEEASGLLS